MNAARRKQIEEARGHIEEAKSILESAQSEEQDYFDNMPESFQNGEKGERASACVDALQSAADSTDEVLNYIEEALQ